MFILRVKSVRYKVIWCNLPGVVKIFTSTSGSATKYKFAVYRDHSVYMLMQNNIKALTALITKTCLFQHTEIFTTKT